jgi:aconitase B
MVNGSRYSQSSGLATGESKLPISESVKVNFKGQMKDYIDLADKRIACIQFGN